jgi:hypothetical protein
MSSAIAASSPSTSLSSTDIDPSTYIQSIQRNWSICSDEGILPAFLVSSVLFACLPAEIIEAVHELSTLTVNQRDRAHSLLNTYSQARVREGSYSGENQSIFAILEVGDVEKACESVKRMTRGRELQGPVPKPVDDAETTGKRKYSIRDEISKKKDGRKAAKTPKPAFEDILEVEDEDEDEEEQEVSLSTLPFTAVEKDQDKYTLPPIPATPRTKRRVRLPPIKTHALHTLLPVPAASSAGFTPIFNHLKNEVGLSLTPNIQHYRPPQVDVKVQAAQRATHEFNVRRIELVKAHAQFEDARWRFEGAKVRMDRARGACGWR